MDWSALAWNATPPSSLVAGASTSAVPVPTTTEATPRYDARPDAYRPSFLYDPVAGDKLLATLAEDHPVELPWAAAAADLARAGVYRHSAPLVARMYDAIEAAQGASDPTSLALRTVDRS